MKKLHGSELLVMIVVMVIRFIVGIILSFRDDIGVCGAERGVGGGYGSFY